MQQNQPAAGSWRGKVKSWLYDVQRYRQAGYDVRSAVQHSQQLFPSNWLLTFSVAIAKDLATKIVRSAIKDAATSLGVTLSDGELDSLAELVIATVAS